MLENNAFNIGRRFYVGALFLLRRKAIMFFNFENKEEDTIYIFVDMDRKVLIPFRGTEEEMLDM